MLLEIGISSYCFSSQTLRSFFFFFHLRLAKTSAKPKAGEKGPTPGRGVLSPEEGALQGSVLRLGSAQRHRCRRPCLSRSHARDRRRRARIPRPLLGVCLRLRSDKTLAEQGVATCLGVVAASPVGLAADASASRHVTGRGCGRARELVGGAGRGWGRGLECEGFWRL